MHGRNWYTLPSSHTTPFTNYATDVPWLDPMSKSAAHNSNNGPTSPQQAYDPNPPTVAAFAPTSSSGYSATAKQRSTIIVHKKSPLLVATPPQITRALAHSHPFILLLNKFVALLSWTTEDAWESFLLVTAFWGVTLYGGVVLRYAGPLVGVVLLILGMYSRRYSPLSSTSKTGEKHEHKRQKSESTSTQHKSLDEIVETVQQFTTRCNILLDPFIAMTDFLSTQRTPTSATTRPALTTLFIRIILVTPLWVLLTLPPFYIFTTRRVILTFGTIILTFHSRPARISRVILWRSVFIRRLSAFITGLDFDTTSTKTKSLMPPLIRTKSASHAHANEFATTTAKRRPASSGVRFTFILFENQRRWIGLGWTTSLFAYERAPWTDEHLNPAPSKDEFELPEVDGGHSRWRWVDDSSWQVENNSKQKRASSPKASGKSKSSASPKGSDHDGEDGGWIYYDNKWNDGRVEDGWGRYTRRRKWFRDAELVEITPSMEVSPAVTPAMQSDVEDGPNEKVRKAKEYAKNLGNADLAASTATIIPEKVVQVKEKDNDATSTKSSKRKSGWFSSEKKDRSTSDSKSSTKAQSITRSDKSFTSQQSRDGPEDDVHDRWRDAASKTLGVGEDVYMGLG